ncbi:sigma-70 family RNA polymerase sigma factor [Solibacillus sp. FSL W7-1472]|uniref:RNA polymerase sigma factor sigV n=1 Tax=Solibacillus isronensis B3W22 TaxID=1224748 RepID=K1LGP6_9BACL|nr:MULTISPECIES: sigma-70 family RNA polymerase sigma factor [Solibacillus]AMO85122.1 RNA polymerase subunit sigma-70 [Solibacillus silvestris]EKB43669.1 RNA polymerase sigma factor sigV [Solibacillus isronensis B3W22]OBW55916.1 RNA polymerase subunit sigma-70 [Solibacillus silvestris]
MIEELENAFITFIRTQQNSLYLLAYSYTKNEQDALDVVQDSIQKGWLALEKLTNRDQMKSWFYTILVRTAIDLLRKQKRVELIGDDSLLLLSEEDSYLNLDLQQALHRLPLQLREVVVLRYFEDLKIEDVAHILTIPLSTAKSRLYRALKLLKIELETEEN